jgi:hypothetical protein
MDRTRLLAFSAVCFLAGGCHGVADDGRDYELDYTSNATSPSADETNPDDAPSSAEDALPSMPKSGDSPDGGAGDAGAPPPPPTKVTVKVSGVTFTVGETKVWANVSGAGNYDIFVPVTGPGVAAGSDIHVWADHKGTGCVNTTNYIAYRPKSDTQYMPMSTNEPACGLTITELPTAVGGRFKGTFKGTLRGINVTPTVTKTIDMTFDVLRTK